MSGLRGQAVTALVFQDPSINLERDREREAGTYMSLVNPVSYISTGPFIVLPYKHADHIQHLLLFICCLLFESILI